MPLYESAVNAHELASELGGVSEEHLSLIEHALIQAFNAGRNGAELL